MPDYPTITEANIRARAGRSFARGEGYYHSGAIRQPTVQGCTLTASCEGSRYEPYQVRVELNDQGIAYTDCSCPYDWGGDCKHIVALLLTWVRQPEQFAVLEEIEALLARKSQKELITIIRAMLARYPNLRDIVVEPPDEAEIDQRHTAVSEGEYAGRVEAAFYGDTDWRGMWQVTEKLDRIQWTADDFARHGDHRNAMIIYTVLLEGCVEHIEECDDSSGGLGMIIDHCGDALVTSVPQVELDDNERQVWLLRLLDSLHEAESYGVGEAVTKPVLAVMAEADEMLVEEYLLGLVGQVQYEHYILDFLKEIYKRRGRTDTYLELYRRRGQHARYIEELIALDRLDEAITYAREHLSEGHSCLRIAELLADRGRLRDAVAIAEKGWQANPSHWGLWRWLVEAYPRAGQMEKALEMRLTRYQQSPSDLEFKAIKALAQQLGRWEAMRSSLIARLYQPFAGASTLINILLSEGEVLKAVQAVDAYGNVVNDDLRLRVAREAEKLATGQPDWVIQQYIGLAEKFMDRRSRQAYRTARTYLLKAKAVYQAHGRMDEWRAYMDGLRKQFPGRKAMHEEFKGLA